MLTKGRITAKRNSNSESRYSNGAIPKKRIKIEKFRALRISFF
jgi:hypothetical protein